MLVLSRRLGERFVVTLNGEVVTIEIMKIGGSRIQIGVDAPKHVLVRRQELLDRFAVDRHESRTLPLARQSVTVGRFQAATIGGSRKPLGSCQKSATRPAG